MNKKAILIILLIAIFPTFTAYTISSFTASTMSDYSYEPMNFQVYPDYFDSTAILTWDLDVMDIDQMLNTFSDVNGEGVYVAVLDTGLVANWRDYFPEERIKEEWGRGFVDKGVMAAILGGGYKPHVVESANFIDDHPHGTHVTSSIIGYGFYGTPVQGVAPKAQVIPVKVLETYSGLQANFGTDYAIAAGIDYVTDLALANPENRFIISMSLGSLTEISPVEQVAVDRAIANNVVIVAAAGNEGINGMDSPGSYAPIISVGATGWSSYTELYGYNGEWLIDGEFVGGWWDEDVPEDNTYVSYVADFSGRINPELGWDQELDVLAPGSWVVGPYPQGFGQSRLPWWAPGVGAGLPGGNFYFVGGTSMATPHVSGLVALMLQVNPNLTPAEVESILKMTADPIPFTGSAWVIYDPSNPVFVEITWGYDGLDAVGSGLVQADAVMDYLI